MTGGAGNHQWIWRCFMDEAGTDALLAVPAQYFLKF